MNVQTKQLEAIKNCLALNTSKSIVLLRLLNYIFQYLESIDSDTIACQNTDLDVILKFIEETI